MRVKQILNLFACVAVSGCATDAALRQESHALSVYIEKVKAEGVEFQQARDKVAKARVATLNFLRANALASEQSVQRDVAAREVAQDKHWQSLFVSLQLAPEVIARQRQERKSAEAAAADALSKAKGAVDVRAAKLTEASTALAGLSEPRTTKDDLKFYRDILDQVKEGLKEKSDSAKAQASEATASSVAKSGASN